MSYRFFLIGFVLLTSQIVVTAQALVNQPVVELFTSEGCSSCPAADDLLKEMSVIREKEGSPFIALAFHITYWNRSGWIDSFSNEAYTQRQKKYIEYLELPLLYTPQAIVNGTEEFIASNPVAFRTKLLALENSPSRYRISATAQKSDESIEVNYKIDKAPLGEFMNVALVEKEAFRKITRGENRSRTLRHFNVVRQFSVTKLKKSDTIVFSKIPVQSDDLMLVLYIQQKTMKIVATIAIPLGV